MPEMSKAARNRFETMILFGTIALGLIAGAVAGGAFTWGFVLVYSFVLCPVSILLAVMESDQAAARNAFIVLFIWAFVFASVISMIINLSGGIFS